MPFAIILTAISAWLADFGISIEVITTFAVARISYSLKFLWAPIVDYFSPPLSWKIGRRKSWMLVCAAVITVILFQMGAMDVKNSLYKFYLLAVALGFFSATFDINYDAFRIDALDKELQGIGAANAVFGYRIGLLIAGAGALEIAHVTGSWSQTIQIMGAVFALSVLFLFTVKEPLIEQQNSLLAKTENPTSEKFNIVFLANSLKQCAINPFKEFLSRKSAIIILLAVVFFKLGDAMLGVVSTPFYLEIGFNKHQIAVGVKLFGVIATILGSYAGGFIIYRLGNFKGLIITGVVQSLNNAIFIWLHHQGADINSLLVTISVENFAGGMGSAALVAYLSSLCNKKYSATQYAMLSSSASFFNNSITAFGGSLVKYLGWDHFFFLTVILGLPAILLFFYLDKIDNNKLQK